MSWLRHLFFFLCFFSFASSIFASSEHPMFSPSEHVTLGNNVQLHFTSNNSGQTGYLFHLPNGLTLTYGEIISLGDFYGLIDQPIAYGKSEAERKARFLAAFSLFSQSANNFVEAKQILTVIREEKRLIDDALKNGEDPEIVYRKIGGENNRKYNCITGGGCSVSTWWTNPGRYLKISSNNFDHFGENAWLAYKAGHQAAIEQAIIAHQTQDLKKLELAYAMNAFACHFLSDRFSAGHIRTPREELPENITPREVGSILSNYMHNEENTNSIHVHNLRGDRWTAYGDGAYFNQKNTTHRALINEVLQISANQIFSAYQFGSEQNDNAIYPIIPIADENEHDSHQDISPLFYWDKSSHKLMRRQDISNLYDRHWTADWWGWSTLALLTQERGMPALTQAKIALSGHGEEAMKYGLITDKDVIQYIKTNSH